MTWRVRLWATGLAMIAVVAVTLPADEPARPRDRLAAASLPEPGSGSGATHGPATSEREDASALALRRAFDLRGALETARRQLPADSPELRSLSEEARVACSIVRRPDASARRVESDPNRRYWLDQLLRRCAGLLDSDLAPPVPTPAAIEQWNRQLPLVAALRGSIEAGVELAQAHVAGSADAQLIAESLRFLHEQERLPLTDIFPGLARPSSGDIEAALIFAADWIACTRSNSCGSDGLWTLYTCAQFGCPDGSDLPRALYRILPAQQFEIAQRLVTWATAQ